MKLTRFLIHKRAESERIQQVQADQQIQNGLNEIEQGLTELKASREETKEIIDRVDERLAAMQGKTSKIIGLLDSVTFDER